MDFSLADLAAWLPVLLDGLGVSLAVAAGSLLLGFPLGLVLALGVQAKSRLVRIPSLAVVEIGRGTPALVLLQFIYFGLPTAGLTIGSYAAAIVALSCNTGAYTSEIIRAGLELVPHGQREAAITIGLSGRDQLGYVILPQGLRVAVPALLGFAILIFQGTSLCFTIAVPELLSRAYEIGSITFKYFPVLLLAGCLYAAICIPTSILVAAVERRVGQFARR